METLLELKDRLKSFYSKYEIYMMPVLKFVLAFVLFFVINKNIGFMERLDSLPVILILALLYSFPEHDGAVCGCADIAPSVRTF